MFLNLRVNVMRIKRKSMAMTRARREWRKKILVLTPLNKGMMMKYKKKHGEDGVEWKKKTCVVNPT
jgi:hypothetical protein